MFDDIEKTIKSALVQKAILKKVVAKKAGRPPKPNMKTYLFKVDEVLHARLSKKAQRLGMTKSAVINMLIGQWLEIWKN